MNPIILKKYYLFLILSSIVTCIQGQENNEGKIKVTYKEFNDSNEEVYEREGSEQDYQILNEHFADTPEGEVIKLVPPKKKKEKVFEGAETKTKEPAKKKEPLKVIKQEKKDKPTVKKPTPVAPKPQRTGINRNSKPSSSRTYSRSKNNKIGFWQSLKLKKKSRKKRRRRFTSKRCYKF